MKIVDGFKMRKLGNEYIVVPESPRLVNFNKMISFNATAAFLWESVAGKEFCADDIRQLILDNYQVDERIAGSDAAKLVQSWKEAGLVSE